MSDEPAAPAGPADWLLSAALTLQIPISPDQAGALIAEMGNWPRPVRLVREPAEPDGNLELERKGYTRRDASRCRGCGAPIIWWETPAGKMSPHDPDGTSHFATCPRQQDFRRAREQKETQP